MLARDYEALADWRTANEARREHPYNSDIGETVAHMQTSLVARAGLRRPYARAELLEELFGDGVMEPTRHHQAALDAKTLYSRRSSSKS